MFYQMWCQVKVEDALREAQKYNLIKAANRPRQTQNRKRLIKLACLLGLTKAC